MADEKLRVSDMPAELELALSERGYRQDQLVGINEAICEWSAWHLGDPAWGSTAIQLFLEAKYKAAKENA